MPGNPFAPENLYGAATAPGSTNPFAPENLYGAAAPPGGISGNPFAPENLYGNQDATQEDEGLGLGRQFLSGSIGMLGNLVSGGEAFLRSPVTPWGIADLLVPGRPYGEMIEDVAGRISEPLFRKAAELAPAPAESFAGRAAQTVAGAAPQLLGVVGASLATGGAAAPALLGGTMAAGASLEEAQARGASSTTAELKALASGIGGAVLEVVGARSIARLFSGLPRDQAVRLATQAGRAMIAEGSTEAGQELYEAGLEAATGSEAAFENIGERMSLAAIAGATLGAAAAGPAALVQQMSPAPQPATPGEERVYAAGHRMDRFHTLGPGSKTPMAERVQQGMRFAYAEILNKEQPFYDVAKRIAEAPVKEAGAPPRSKTEAEKAAALAQMNNLIYQHRGVNASATSPIIHRPTTLQEVAPGVLRNTQLIREVDMGPDQGVVQRPNGIAAPLEILSGQAIPDYGIAETPLGTDPRRAHAFSRYLSAMREVYDLSQREEVQTEPERTAIAREYLATMQRETPELYANFTQRAQALREWSVVSMLDPLVRVGRIAKETRDLFLVKNPHWAPFYRLKVDHGEFHPTDTAAQKRIKKGLDEDDPSGDPIVDMIRKAVSIQRWVARQDIRNQIGNWADEYSDVLDDIQKYVAPARAAATIPEIDPETGQPAVDEQGRPVLETLYRPAQGVPENSFPTWSNGQATHYTSSNPLLMRAMDRLTPQQLRWWLKILRVPAATLRAGATSTLEFAFSNLGRDQVAMAINAKYGYVPIWDMFRGMAEVVKRGDIFQELARSGGFISNLVDVDRDLNIYDLDDVLLYLKKGIIPREFAHWKQTLKKPKRTIAKIGQGEDLLDNLTALPGDLVDVMLHPHQRFSAFLEMSTRTGAAVRAAKGSPILGRIPGLNFQVEGVGTPGMVEVAREGTLDFGRSGGKMVTWNTVEAFANPAVQDPDRYVRSLRAAPAHTMLMTGALIAIPAAINFFSNYEDPEYQDTPEWEKTVYYHLPWLRLPGGERPRIPRPIGLMNLLGGVLVEKFLGKLVGADPAVGVTLKEALMRDTPAGFVGIEALPNAIQPWVEAYGSPAGFSQFRDAPIVPRSLVDRRLPGEQVTPYTSKTMREIGGALGTSPAKLDYLVRSNFGTAGDWLLDATDLMLGETPGGQRRTGPAELPVVRRFVSRKPFGPSSRPVNTFYEVVKQAEQQEGSYKALLAEKRQISADEAARRFPLVAWRRPLAAARRRFSDVQKARAEAVRQQQWDKVDRIDRQLTDVARRYLEEAGIYRPRGSKPELERQADAELRKWLADHPDATPWQVAQIKRSIYMRIRGAM